MSDTVLLPTALADRFRSWADLASTGDLKAAKAVWKTLHDKVETSLVPRPRGDDGKALIDSDLWRAASNWKGGRLLTRYWASIETAVEAEETPKVETRIIYLEELKKPHMKRPDYRSRYDPKVPHKYRILSGGLGLSGTFTNMDDSYALTATDAVDSALMDLRRDVDAAEHKVREKKAALARGEALVADWVSRNGVSK